MLDEKDQGLVLMIMSHCERLVSKFNGVSKEEFTDSEDLRECAAFNLLQIGELAKKLSVSFKSEHNGMQWAQIAGLRNILVHAYFTIDLDMIWYAVQNDIPSLLEYLKEIISNSTHN